MTIFAPAESHVSSTVLPPRKRCWQRTPKRHCVGTICILSAPDRDRSRSLRMRPAVRSVSAGCTMVPTRNRSW